MSGSDCLYTKPCDAWEQNLPISLRWRHNDHAGVSNHQPRGCLLNRLFRRKSKKTSKLRVTGLCAGNSPGTGEFPAQMASYAENVSIWWRHHVVVCRLSIIMSIISATDFNRRCGKLVYNEYCFLKRMMARLVEPGKHPRKMVCQCQMINILGSYTIFWCKRPFVPNRSVEIRRLIIWPINSSPPNVAYMGQWIGSVLVQIMACHLFGAKPLSKPMLDQLDP